jgi:hypothetical protein
MLRTALIYLLSLIVGKAAAQEKTTEPEQKHPIPKFDFCVLRKLFPEPTKVLPP